MPVFQECNIVFSTKIKNQLKTLNLKYLYKNKTFFLIIQIFGATKKMFVSIF